jgi:outer membrane protein assembly factor BamB
MAIFEGAQRNRRPTVPQALLIVGVAVLMSLLLPPSGFVSSAAAPVAPGSSELSSFALTAPTVAGHTHFNLSSASGTSPSFHSNTGDTLVVFFSVFGGNSVNVADSAHDTFSTLETASQPSLNGGSSFWIFAAYNISAGATKTVTATLSGGSTDSAAGVVIDVAGVGAHPLDSLGTLTNYSATGQPSNSSTAIPAAPSDLVLGAVSAHETRVWSAAGTDTLLNDEHSPVKNALMTTVGLDSVAATTGTAWINATTTRPGTYWMSDGLSLLPKGSSGGSGTFTFSETGLPVGHSWYVAVGTTINSSTTSTISISQPSGTYAFTVSPISGWVATPASGTITVGGSIRTQAVTFAAATDDWPTYMGQVTRNGDNFNESTLSVADAPNLTELWSSSTSYMQSEPIVKQDTVYVGSTNGNEYSINATTGVQNWHTFLGQVVQPNCDPKPQGLTSSATIYQGMIYVGGANNTGNTTNGTANWFALNASTGKIAWQIPIGLISSGYYNWASPLIVNGFAYVGIASRCDEPLVWGGLLKVSLSTHKVVGYFNTTVGGGNTRGSSIWGSPTYVAATNTIYVATGNPLKTHVTNFSEAVIAINATSLAPIGKWQIPASQAIKDSDFGTTPDYYHLPSGRALVSAMNKNGIVYTLNATNVSAGPYWERLVSYSAYPENVAPLAWGDGLLFDGSGPTNIAGKNYSGGLRAIYPNNGTIKWIHGFGGDVYGAPAFANGIVVAAGGTKLEVFNASTGALLWNWSCGESFNSGPSIAEGRIYAACAETYAFGFTGVAAGPLQSPNELRALLPHTTTALSTIPPASTSYPSFAIAVPRLVTAAWSPKVRTDP